MKSGSRSRTNSSSETNPGSRRNRSWERSSIRSTNVPHETIEIGFLDEPEPDAPVEATIEAVRVEETRRRPCQSRSRSRPNQYQEMFGDAPVDSAPLEELPAVEPIEADPAPSSDLWFQSLARQLDVASSEPPPSQADVAAPLGDVPLEGVPAEQSNRDTSRGSDRRPRGRRQVLNCLDRSSFRASRCRRRATQWAKRERDEIHEEPIEIDDAEQQVETFRRAVRGERPTSFASHARSVTANGRGD